MNGKGVQNAQMQGSHGTPASPEMGEWPWARMAEGAPLWSPATDVHRFPGLGLCRAESGNLKIEAGSGVTPVGAL